MTATLFGGHWQIEQRPGGYRLLCRGCRRRCHRHGRRDRCRRDGSGRGQRQRWREDRGGFDHQRVIANRLRDNCCIAQALTDRDAARRRATGIDQR